MNDNFRISLLIGFDRCGSSMISRLLSKHPQVNLLFQPFNSSEISQTQWEYWYPAEEHSLTEQFFRGLQKGEIDIQYIKSKWFFNYSDSCEIKAETVNLIKDTKFHFKLSWLQKHFPSIKFYGIWRNPRDILLSLIRNNYHKEWYGYLTPDILRKPVFSLEFLHPYSKIADTELDEIELMALGIVIRTQAIIEVLSPKDWLIYEDMVHDPDILNVFVRRFGLQDFSFKDHIHNDYNVAGRMLNKESISSVLSKPQLKTIEELFNLLEDSFKNKISA